MAVIARFIAGPAFPLAGFVGFGVLFWVFVAATGSWWAVDANDYDNWSRLLIELDFDYRRLIEIVPFPVTYYTLFLTVIAGLKLALGEAWKLSWLGLNIISAAAVAAITIAYAQSIGRGLIAALATVGLLLVTWDMHYYVRVFHSDMFGNLITLGVFVTACDAALSRRWGSWIPAVLLLVAAVLTRPTGIAAGLAFVVLAIVIAPAAAMESPGQRARYGRRLFAAATVVTVGGFAISAWVLQNLGSIPALADNQQLDLMRQYFFKGDLVRGRPNSVYFPVHDTLTIFLAMLLKVLLFFQFTTADFSFAHKAVAIASHVPLYLLAGTGAVAAFFAPGAMGSRTQIVAMLSVAFILSFASLHAATILDYDWRYRTPVYPALIFLAVAGADFIVSAVWPKRPAYV
jgi:hypothetical protein